MNTVTLTPLKEKSLLRRHPWIYANAIERVDGRPAPSASVVVRAHDGRFLARAAWSPHSQIRARVWSFDETEPVDHAFFKRRVQRALAHRRALVRDTSAARLIFGEADGLPGLIVDYYAAPQVFPGDADAVQAPQAFAENIASRTRRENAASIPPENATASVFSGDATQRMPLAKAARAAQAGQQARPGDAATGLSKITETTEIAETTETTEITGIIGTTGITRVSEMTGTTEVTDASPARSQLVCQFMAADVDAWKTTETTEITETIETTGITRVSEMTETTEVADASPARGQLVCQFMAAGVDAWKEAIVAALVHATGCPNVYERSDVSIRDKEGLAQTTGVLAGDAPPDTLVMVENGVRYRVDVKNGHKTGFYLDQRENRALVQAFARGRDVLNCFCYTGGFSLAALKGGAARVVSVDSSGEALALARRNVVENGFDAARASWLDADAFKTLRRLYDEGERFDLVVLDPPKFAPAREHVGRAARAYKDINLTGLKLLRPGGLLFTYSCSGAIDAALFQKIVAGAAADARVDVRILKRLGAGVDHPLLGAFPEGEYLKGLLLQVV